MKNIKIADYLKKFKTVAKKYEQPGKEKTDLLLSQLTEIASKIKRIDPKSLLELTKSGDPAVELMAAFYAFD